MKGKPPVVVHLSKKPGHALKSPGFPAPAKKKAPPQPERDCKGPPAERKEIDPDNFHIALRSTWGGALRIDPQKGYLLHGRGINFDDLMTCTNRIRKERGMPLIGRKPDWLR